MIQQTIKTIWVNPWKKMRSVCFFLEGIIFRERSFLINLISSLQIFPLGSILFLTSTPSFFMVENELKGDEFMVKNAFLFFIMISFALTLSLPFVKEPVSYTHLSLPTNREV